MKVRDSIIENNAATLLGISFYSTQNSDIPLKKYIAKDWYDLSLITKNMIISFSVCVKKLMVESLNLTVITYLIVMNSSLKVT